MCITEFLWQHILFKLLAIIGCVILLDTTLTQVTLMYANIKTKLLKLVESCTNTIIDYTWYNIQHDDAAENSSQ